jgi:glycosyltransferase involved in cell wall biosynthesis
VRLLGSRAPDDLPDLYAAADVFALATEREGWPNAVVEALACGIPVVATRTGGVPELVADGEQGYLVEDAEGALTAALARALDRPWDRDRVAERVRRRGWGDVAREVDEELAAALATSRDQRRTDDA